MIDETKLNELLGKVVGDVGAAMSAALVVIGSRLGLYRAMHKLGPSSISAIAREAGIGERYAREWLLNQAASGYITFDERTDRYSLTEEQALAFAIEDSPAAMGGAFEIIGAVHRDTDKLQGAIKGGQGVPWGEHDTCLFCGTERFFAASYRANLVGQWLPALDGIVQRLNAGAIVADVGCGHGASTVLMAKAFPKSRFIGFDFHAPSIECARERARAVGAHNATFEVADSTTFPAPTREGGYDLVCCFDCLHDMGNPAGCAARVYETLQPGGAWMVVEPAAGDTVSENLNPVARVFSAASTMICVPASLAFGGPALGACAGPTKLTQTIKEGGFDRVRVATRTPFNLVLEARR